MCVCFIIGKTTLMESGILLLDDLDHQYLLIDIAAMVKSGDGFLFTSLQLP